VGNDTLFCWLHLRVGLPVIYCVITRISRLFSVVRGSPAQRLFFCLTSATLARSKKRVADFYFALAVSLHLWIKKMAAYGRGPLWGAASLAPDFQRAPLGPRVR
jgi:hypothetical protein